MASLQRKKRGDAAKRTPVSETLTLPPPFRPLPAILQPFADEHLSPPHVYVVHVDDAPAHDAAFKRRIFLVPVLLNLSVAALFVWRAWAVAPWYWALIKSGIGGEINETTVIGVSDMSWRETSWIIARRAATMALDLALATFLWPWPLDFVLGRRWLQFGTADGPKKGRSMLDDDGWHGSPVLWRRAVGFRDREVVVRRSRGVWEREAILGPLLDSKASSTGPPEDEADFDETSTPLFLRNDSDDKTKQRVLGARRRLLTTVAKATDPLILRNKTGYLLMDGEWDLDWAAMVSATRLVDSHEVALDAFRAVVFVWAGEALGGWVSVDLKLLRGESPTRGDGQTGFDSSEAERRDQVFAFRDALAAIGKEDLFFRWIEVVQFEATRPGGGMNTPERQAEVAAKVRELFSNEGVDFDTFWRESVERAKAGESGASK